jgi:hypothetical protein
MHVGEAGAPPPVVIGTHRDGATGWLSMVLQPR